MCSALTYYNVSLLISRRCHLYDAVGNIVVSQNAGKPVVCSLLFHLTTVLIVYVYVYCVLCTYDQS